MDYLEQRLQAFRLVTYDGYHGSRTVCDQHGVIAFSTGVARKDGAEIQFFHNLKDGSVCTFWVTDPTRR